MKRAGVRTPGDARAATVAADDDRMPACYPSAMDTSDGARYVGHGLAVLLGLAALIAGVEAFSHDMPNTMGATLLVVGTLMPVLAWYTWRRSRAAWSYLIALLAVLAAVFFFGAPKVRTVLGVSLWVALIVPALQITAVVALAMLRHDYRDQR